VGPELAVEARRAGFFAAVSGNWIGYQLSTVDVDFSGGGNGRVHGGSSFYSTAGVGWRAFLGPDPAASPWLAASLGGLYEEHAGQDVADPTGRKLGVLTSYTDLALEIRADGRLPIARGLALSGGLGISPVGSYRESPSGTTGTDPKAIAYDWRLGVGFARPGGLLMRLEYSGEEEQVRYSGAGSSALSPAESGARVEQTTHVLAVEIGRGF
jgi:hypothetical protein